MGGGRVVPIPYTTDRALLLRIFKSINGLLFTGGSGDLHINDTFTPFQLIGNYLIDLAI